MGNAMIIEPKLPFREAMKGRGKLFLIAAFSLSLLVVGFLWGAFIGRHLPEQTLGQALWSIAEGLAGWMAMSAFILAILLGGNAFTYATIEKRLSGVCPGNAHCYECFFNGYTQPRSWMEFPERHIAGKYRGIEFKCTYYVLYHQHNDIRGLIITNLVPKGFRPNELLRSEYSEGKRMEMRGDSILQLYISKKYLDKNPGWILDRLLDPLADSIATEFALAQ